ncbi:probable C-mannosyltransferase DPY19L1 [Galendromus occidentalis]|uniref:Probable C-mannosyltransferase DPY19L1 n=1 Tax=Galendromus occidentalis TaxID=34638 RepID=A0AAJ7PA73_9ACAR|nr:probable C-mannosyltransferase DPY19L1 [Galendromus occidentalis]
MAEAPSDGESLGETSAEEQADLDGSETPVEPSTTGQAQVSTEPKLGKSFNRTQKFIFLACMVGYLNSMIASTLFENDSFFSHLSELEREMTFRTEMGLYYSYFKRFTEAPDTVTAFQELIWDNRTEYPGTINVIKRFNIYPEIVMGVAYRAASFVSDFLGMDAKDCYTVVRGEERSSVYSCTGLGDPAVFYTTLVHWWNFISGVSIAGLAALLSNSFLGTLLCAALYFFNFDQATRVQWTPPLRESFGYPLLIAQITLTSYTIRERAKPIHPFIYVLISTMCLLCWQFSQFVFTAEIACLYAVYIFHERISKTLMQYIACMHLCAISIAYIFLCFNDMLLCSLYAAIVVVTIICSEAQLFSKWRLVRIRMLLQMGVLLLTTLGVKMLLAYLLNSNDDGHIFYLLASKISDYRNFDTMLYTCAPEFDFLKLDYVKNLSLTVGASLLMMLGVCAWALYQGVKFPTDIIYNFYQCTAFGAMAFTFMRLKVLLTPHLCIMSAIALSPKLLPNKDARRAIAACVFAVTLLPGMHSIYHQHSHQGEYMNSDLEELMYFINDFAEPNDSFAGPMPLMANILLSTGRPIINHPHYENAALRNKTKSVYTLLSRKPLAEVHQNLKNLQARFVIIPRAWCLGKFRNGCSLTEIWDELDPDNRGKPLVCQRLLREDTEGLFEEIFSNEEYSMFSLGEGGAQYPPRRVPRNI